MVGEYFTEMAQAVALLPAIVGGSVVYGLLGYKVFGELKNKLFTDHRTSAELSMWERMLRQYFYPINYVMWDERGDADIFRIFLSGSTCDLHRSEVNQRFTWLMTFIWPVAFVLHTAIFVPHSCVMTIRWCALKADDYLKKFADRYGTPWLKRLLKWRPPDQLATAKESLTRLKAYIQELFDYCQWLYRYEIHIREQIEKWEGIIAEAVEIGLETTKYELMVVSLQARLASVGTQITQSKAATDELRAKQVLVEFQLRAVDEYNSTAKLIAFSDSNITREVKIMMAASEEAFRASDAIYQRESEALAQFDFATIELQAENHVEQQVVLERQLKEV